jgi:CheY-like chemotaxis protein
MNRRGESAVRVVVLGLLLLGAGGWTALGGEETTKDPLAFFREGVDYFLQGRYADAEKKLRDFLDTNPTNELCEEAVNQAGQHAMSRMMSQPRMGNAPVRVWQKYRQAVIARMTNKEAMAKKVALLVDPQTSERERTRLYREMAELSHYVIPLLVPHLKNPQQSQQRTVAREALFRMGSRATLPLIALVDHKEVLMREQAILALQDVIPADERALPVLKGRIEDPGESATVKACAEKALRRITGLPPETWKGAAQYYLEAAHRYYLQAPGVAEEAEISEGFVWHVNEAGDLVNVQHPLWAWNEQMAEELLIHGLRLKKDFQPFYMLAACLFAAQHQEVKDYMDILSEEPAKSFLRKEEQEAIAAWDKKAPDCRKLVLAMSAKHVYDGLGQVLADLQQQPDHPRLPGIGVFLCGVLKDLDPQGKQLPAMLPPPAEGAASDKQAAPPPVNPLVQALDCPDLGIQYAAALALAAMNKFPEEWSGQEKVAERLGRGVSENKPYQILVAHEDMNVRNEMKPLLEKLGYHMTAADNGYQALELARSFPPKDMVLISDKLSINLKPEQLMAELKGDLRTRFLACAILHNQADRKEVQARFGAELPLVEREMKDAELKEAVERVAKQRQSVALAKRKAEEIAVACATALSNFDPRWTRLRLDDAVPACIAALVNRSDEVRVPAALFLGKVRGGAGAEAAGQKLAAAAKDPSNSTKVRAACLHALGQVKPEAYGKLFLEFQKEAEEVLQAEAALGYGAITRGDAELLEFIQTKRIDKEKKEK